MKGSLKDYSLPKIMVSLHNRKATGTLEVSTNLFTKKVFFVSGDAIFAASTCEDDRLGEMLLKAGKINLEQYEKSVELLKKTKKRQGAILVELGYLTPKDLFWGVKYQVKEIILSLFLLEDGEYEFIPDKVPDDEVITLKMSLGQLLYEGVKRIDNWTRIQREMPSMDTVLVLSSDPLSLFQEVTLSSDEKEVLSLIDGRRTVKDILNISKLGSFKALKTLYILYSLGILVEKVAEPAEEPPVEEVLSENSIDADVQAFIAEVEELYSKLDSLSEHELLNVEPGADNKTIKRNYYQLAKRYHPDKYYTLEVEGLKEKLTQIFDAITKAYNSIVANATEAQEEVSNREETDTPEPNEIRALNQFKRGVHEYKEGNYWTAADAFRWATRLDPKNPKYWSHLSIALIKLPNRLKQAEEALLEAIKLDPFNPHYYATLGQIYIKAGLKKRAKKQFEQALKIDPSNEKARKGLKILEQR
jgi:tetratricopeptide (TPR) repeat protein